MSCTSIKNKIASLKNQGNLNFNQAVELYDDLKGSLDAHRLELKELEKFGDQNRMDHLRQHINDGEQMLTELSGMTLR